MLKISQSVEKAVSEAEDYFGTLSNGNTVSCTDIITLADKEEVKKIAEKNDCDVKIGDFSVVFFDKGEVAENFKEMVGQSRKPIKSGTSNFGSNDNIFGYNFPLVTYIAENYVYDEENDVEREERDYDADNLEYEDAKANAEDLAYDMDIPWYDDYSEPYLCHEPFMIQVKSGYYEGLYIKIREGTDEEDVYSNDPRYGSVYEGGRPFTEEEMKAFESKINAYLDKLCSDYGWFKVGVTARFNNGETWYHKINNSRKLAKNVIKSSKTQEIFNKAILKAAELVKLSNEENEDEESVEKQNGELSDITSELIDLPFDFELEPQELKAYIKKVVPADYFDDERCWSYLYDIVYEDVYENIGFDAEPVNSSMRTNTKKPIKSSYLYTVEINMKDGNVYQEDYEAESDKWSEAKKEIRANVESDFPEMKNFTMIEKNVITSSSKPIKSSGAFVDKDEDGSPECIIEIKEDGKWKAVGIDKNSPDGWSTDVKFKVFPSVDEAKRSGMAKRIKNAGYSEPDTLRFSSK